MHEFVYTGVVALLIVVIDGARESGVSVCVIPCASSLLLCDMSCSEGNVVVIGSG